MPEGIPDSVGRYKILELLGSGGMGTVYRARDGRLTRDVALKVLLPHVAADAEALARFEREVQAVAPISHPNLVKIYEFGHENEKVFATMELVTGPTLRKRLANGPLSPRKSVEVAAQIARGLAAAHDRNLVHRDLKPENIAFARNGHVKILDFGLVREFGSTLGKSTMAPQTLPGVVLGTPAYMSPEQVRAEAVDHRSDVFSLGAVLFEMLTGRQAFVRPTVANTMSAILDKETESLIDTDSRISPALDRVVSRCLEKDPANRFQSADDLAFALDISLDRGRRQMGRSESRARRGRKIAAQGCGRRRPRSGAFVDPSVHGPSAHALRFYSRVDTVRLRQRPPSASPAHDEWAFASTRDGESVIWRREMDSALEHPLIDGRRPRYFADGQSILFLRKQGRSYSAWRLPSGGGVATPLLLDDVVEADPSPNGEEIAFVRSRIEVMDDPEVDSETPAVTVAVLGTKALGNGTERELLTVRKGRDLLRRQQLTGIVTRESATFAWIRRVHRRNAAGKTRLDGGLLKRCHFGL